MKQLLALLTIVVSVTTAMFIASGTAYAVNNDASQQQAENMPLSASQSCSLMGKKV
ncbi:MAG: hypothetical protein PF440_09695 [Thiomicrorhabdus sp.]|jgi:hypothetical protein|nr:hypothetical protein [Thiomicrorhabdus sp.]